MHVILIIIGMFISLTTYIALYLKIQWYYQLDSATEEGLGMYLEHHGTSITIFENEGLFWVFANRVTYNETRYFSGSYIYV